jgi:hypothetical protein
MTSPKIPKPLYEVASDCSSPVVDPWSIPTFIVVKIPKLPLSICREMLVMEFGGSRDAWFIATESEGTFLIHVYVDFNGILARAL